MIFRILIIGFLLVSCSETYKKPNYIKFNLTTDSIFVITKNKNVSPIFIKIVDKTAKEQFIDIDKKSEKVLLKFNKSVVDTNYVLEHYKFYGYYGISNLKNYDTLYNYQLPFLKGKRYRVLQGNFGSYSHYKITSKYAIDFKMKIGQEVCAIRDAIVVDVKNHFEKNGTSKKYLNKANVVFAMHKDGTYVQYAHFKKNGVLVSKGDSIKKGQIIGYSGNTGFSSEPHLHFTIYKPTKNGLVSIPFILDSIPSSKYKKGKYALHN
ncbi:M23 family metallopeptidase [Polaribacter sp. KT 15]|uniref:M23 family metallopeptidase n=1 Tax=Polaribacter sp. KT 15 TaxID=1896175 RepID=UPI000909CB97|nr:M23 family metallopeptidase [Polaribacter sp. KT 15]SHM76357.1 Murein DD-endopeptidase MepM and murein hydrolase activator NlpD, contain LysM domain [Polaribacter sp. KT 15]